MIFRLELLKRFSGDNEYTICVKRPMHPELITGRMFPTLSLPFEAIIGDRR